MHPKETGNTVRETSSSIIVNELERVAKRSKELVSVVAERTSPVSMQSMADRPTAPPAGTPFPPLFSRIRELTNTINDSLGEIEDNMNRIEL